METPMKKLPLIWFAFWLLLPTSLAMAGDNEAIKKLAEDLKGGKGRAAEGLVKHGAAAVDALIEILKNGDNFAKGHAAQALGRIGPAAKAGIGALAETLADKDQTVATQAGFALGQIGPAAVPALIEALKSDKGEPVLGHAARALKKIGPEGKAALPALIPAFKKVTSPEQRAALIDAVAAMGPAAKEAAPALIEYYKDPGKAPELMQQQVRIHVVAEIGRAHV